MKGRGRGGEYKRVTMLRRKKDRIERAGSLEPHWITSRKGKNCKGNGWGAPWCQNGKGDSGKKEMKSSKFLSGLNEHRLQGQNAKATWIDEEKSGEEKGGGVIN